VARRACNINLINTHMSAETTQPHHPSDEQMRRDIDDVVVCLDNYKVNRAPNALWCALRKMVYLADGVRVAITLFDGVQPRVVATPGTSAEDFATLLATCAKLSAAPQLQLEFSENHDNG
jgi:hypothetical protein